MNASIAFSTISNTGNIRSNKRGGLFQLGIVKPVRKVYESNQRRCIKDYFVIALYYLIIVSFIISYPQFKFADKRYW